MTSPNHNNKFAIVMAVIIACVLSGGVGLWSIALAQSVGAGVVLTVTVGMGGASSWLVLRLTKLDKKRRDEQIDEMQFLLDQNEDAVLILDREMCIVNANHVAENLFNLGSKKIVGKSIQQVMGKGNVLEGIVGFITDEKILDGQGEMVLVDDHPSVGSNGIKIALGQLKGEPCYVLTFMGGQRTPSDLNMRERFTERASHEFRTPLAAIQAYVEMLLDGEADDEKTRQAFYNIIQSETLRLSSLIDKVLKISCIESKELKTEMKMLNFEGLVGGVIDQMKPESDRKGVSVMRKPSEADGGFNVFADAKLLEEAVHNIFSNAIKFTPRTKGFSVETGVDVLGRCVFLEVIDQGVGIDRDELPHIFEKFYRGKTNEWYAKGTGLGLSLTQLIVADIHGGRVKVESQINQGSIFRIEIPLRSRCVIKPADFKTHVEGAIG